MPTPKPNEKEEDYISRCIPIVINEGTTKDPKQASAICYSMWREHKKKKDMSDITTHEELVDAIKSRQITESEFNYGIFTADRYVKTIQECIGSDSCYKFMAKGNVSFNDVMEKASKTLTYNNPEMIVKDVYNDASGMDLELPKNTLMVFRHVLTTPRKDRDGDILRTQGARLDPKMLLLWQHVHTLPIGKFLQIYVHNSKTLEVYSAIVDMNDLSHDSAVMVDNGMGRFSHGFKAIEFNSMKEEQGKVTKPAGFDVKLFEILEESLVSVPSNIDADTQEIIVDLVEGGKMTSSVMKNMGKEFRTKMTKQFNLPIDIKLTLNGKEIGDANEPGTGKNAAGTGKEKACGCGGASKEADADRTEDEDIETKNKEGDVNQADADADNDMGSQICPHCGIASNNEDGKCSSCGMELKKDFDGEEKAGKVLSNQNYKMIKDVHDSMDDLYDGAATRSHKALAKECKAKLGKVLEGAATQEAGTGEISVKDAMKILVLEAESSQRKQLIETLQALEDIDTKAKQTEAWKKISGKR